MGSPCLKWGSSRAGGSDDLTARLGIDRSPRGCFHQASWPQQTRLPYTVASEQCSTWVTSRAAKPPEGRLRNPTLQHHFRNILLVKAHDQSQGPRGNTLHLFGEGLQVTVATPLNLLQFHSALPGDHSLGTFTGPHGGVSSVLLYLKPGGSLKVHTAIQNLSPDSRAYTPKCCTWCVRLKLFQSRTRASVTYLPGRLGLSPRIPPCSHGDAEPAVGAENSYLWRKPLFNVQTLLT